MQIAVRIFVLFMFSVLEALPVAGTQIAPNPNLGLIVIAPSESAWNYDDFLNQGTIQVQGYLDNHGQLINAGSLSTTSSGVIYNWAALTNEGSIDVQYYINNYGQLINAGDLSTTGPGVIYNWATLSTLPGSTLSGSVENQWDFQVGGAAQLSGYSEYGTTHVLASGSVDLTGTYANLGGALVVSGSFRNHASDLMLVDYRGSIEVRAGGSFQNDGTISGDATAQPVLNAGTFTNTAGAFLDLSVVNEVGGNLISQGIWQGQSLTNHGTAQLESYGSSHSVDFLGNITNAATGVLDLGYTDLRGSIHNDGLLRLPLGLQLSSLGFTQGVSGLTQIGWSLNSNLDGLTLTGRIQGDPGAILSVYGDTTIAQGAVVSFDSVDSLSELVNQGTLRGDDLWINGRFVNEGNFSGVLRQGQNSTTTNSGHLTLLGFDESAGSVLHNLSGGLVETFDGFYVGRTSVLNEGAWVSQGDAVFSGTNTGTFDHDWGNLFWSDVAQAGRLRIGLQSTAYLDRVSTAPTSVIENEGWLSTDAAGLVGGGTFRQISGDAYVSGPLQQDLIELVGGTVFVAGDYQQASDETLSIQLGPTTHGVLDAVGHVSFLGTIAVDVASPPGVDLGWEFITVLGTSIDISQAFLDFPLITVAPGLRYGLVADVVGLTGGREGLRLTVVVPEAGIAFLLAVSFFALARESARRNSSPRCSVTRRTT